MQELSLNQQVRLAIHQVLAENFSWQGSSDSLVINQTKPEFEGDFTLVLFGLAKTLGSSPDQIGQSVGASLLKKQPALFSAFQVVKGFLNLSIPDKKWIEDFTRTSQNKTSVDTPRPRQRVLVEYSSPNTNKPLHLGHLRNIFLGWSISAILKKMGQSVVKSCVVNDRGIHICKSMIAWQRFGKGATPTTTGMKGDHFVGHYYVLFNDAYKKEVDALVAEGMTKERAEQEAPILKATQEMLLRWEQGDAATRELWKIMNDWVYEGFDQTYQRVGADFDKIYYESETYLLGKTFVEEGLTSGVFFRKPDGSVWIDLTDDGLDEKLVLRKDGTSVYITQDLGLAQQKYDEFAYDQSIYVIADEQNYHMKVLKLILRKLGKPYAEGILHLSYGMVELPTGRMKSREGTVVDADDITQEMVEVARKKTEELGKVQDFTHQELKELYETLALGALKFYLLRVDPKKKMVFNPEESIDFQGFTGPFIQYTHARIRSILRKAGEPLAIPINASLLPKEKELLVLLAQYPAHLHQSAQEQNPSVLANYTYTLAKSFNGFYAEHSVMQAESEEKRYLRTKICQEIAATISEAMALLGIRVPERM
ncbi:MAG: arginine--tRNA ligase [Bacteroidetes bacterium]|nr:arginine--tRNA ligase [Bacteroidota bacterium]